MVLNVEVKVQYNMIAYLTLSDIRYMYILQETYVSQHNDTFYRHYILIGKEGEEGKLLLWGICKVGKEDLYVQMFSHDIK